MEFRRTKRTIHGLLRAALAAAALLAVAGAAGAQVPSLAQDPTGTGVSGPPEWAYSMAHDLMSPFCPGRTLAACPSPQADELRQWILFQAAAGQSREQIEKVLFERFGDVMRQEPRAEGGWGISAYVIPVAGFLLGGALVAFVIHRIAGGGGAPAPPAAPRTPDSSAPRLPGRSASRLSDAELERLVDEELAGS
jgi:cytochrome c-type biogenesis protein CcmH/NrfF